MSYGKNLRIENEDGQGILLRAPTKEEKQSLIADYNEPNVAETTLQLSAATLETQEKYYEHLIHDKNSIAWGIFVDAKEKDGEPIYVGNTSLHLRDAETQTWSTGVLITNPDYRGKGIGTLAHLGRTWWAANMLGVRFIKTEAVSGSISTDYEGDFEKWKETESIEFGNWPSRKALERAGYQLFDTDPAQVFRRGFNLGFWRFRWINPLKVNEIFPNGIPDKYSESLKLAVETLEKAEKMIKNI